MKERMGESEGEMDKITPLSARKLIQELMYGRRINVCVNENMKKGSEDMGA